MNGFIERNIKIWFVTVANLGIVIPTEVEGSRIQLIAPISTLWRNLPFYYSNATLLQNKPIYN